MKKVVADMIASLRSGGLARRNCVSVTTSQFANKFLDILYFEGFIDGYSIDINNEFKVKVYISYLSDDLPLISSLRLISRPGRRYFISFKELSDKYSGKFCILSTSEGLITGRVALEKKIGGELVCIRYYF